MNKKEPISFYIIFSAFTVALGSFLFGYHTGIISGSLAYIANEFHLSILHQGMVVSILLIGAFLGALSAGISDWLGRRPTLFITIFFYLLGTFFLVHGHSYIALLIGRFIAGYAIGIVTVIVPLYIAEISPADHRGSLVSINQLMTTIGILVAFGTAYFFSEQDDWRDMFTFAYFPALLQFVFLFFIPETPSWLMSQNRVVAAKKALYRLRGVPMDVEFIEIEKKEDKPTSKSFKALLDPSIRAPFLVGVSISIIQQITGINTVIYYAPHIFRLAGFASTESAVYATIWVGVINVLMTIVGLWLADKVGRRLLALIGLAGMALSLAVLGTSFFIDTREVGLISVISLLAYIAFFASGLGIVTSLIISEIFPLGIRARAMSISIFSNWAFNYVISLTFLPLIQLMTIGGVYWMFAAISFVSFFFVLRKIPETKGKTFEEIQHFWHK